VDGENISCFKTFVSTSFSEKGVKGFLFTWEITIQVKLQAKMQLPDHANELTIECELQNKSESTVNSLEYPLISNISSITKDGHNDYFVHSLATGVQIQNPLRNFDDKSNGFRYMPYPEGFSGATMQFLSYYGRGKGGLYFAAYDKEGYLKWLNFYKNDNNLLEVSFIHACEDMGAEKGLVVPYQIVVKLLDGDGWYEAADIYKEWAVQQFWCQKGLLSDREETSKASWLLEDIGVATFGINASHDRTDWLTKYQKEINTKMFHILGPDWAYKTQDFGNSVPGGYDDWFPTKFNRGNLEVMKANGDKFAPFEFDYLFNVNGADGEYGGKALQKIPKAKSIDSYNFPLLCPVDSFVQNLHVRRDVKLQEEADVDSIYYDISANNIMKICMDKSHGHSVGAGKQVTMGYRRNYLETKEAMEKVAGNRYIPMGTEMINEVFLDILDYYQARAGGQPAAPLEGWNLRDLFKSGDAELIPLFTYVYHEYGAVRLDGWGKLVEEIGDLFYFTVARTYLWGGIYELNYEYSPMEVINAQENNVEEHYYPFEQRGYHFNVEMAHYLSKFANWRTGKGQKYLAYGKMLKPLKFLCDSIKLNWHLYNCAKDFKEYNDSGELEVDSIVHSAWQFQNESIGLFFANVSDRERKIEIELDSKVEQLKKQSIKVLLHTETDADELFSMKIGDNKHIEFTIPKREVVLIELL